MKTIQELQEIRKKLHMSYDELSEKSGLSKSTITNIFCGYVNYPRVDTMQAIERALGLNTITKEERAAGVVDTATVEITPIEDELLTLFRELGQKSGEKAQRSIINVIESLLS